MENKEERNLMEDMRNQLIELKQKNKQVEKDIEEMQERLDGLEKKEHIFDVDFAIIKQSLEQIKTTLDENKKIVQNINKDKLAKYDKVFWALGLALIGFLMKGFLEMLFPHIG